LKKDNKSNVIQSLRLGVYGNIQQNIKATSDIVRETIFYDGNGGFFRLDSVYEEGVKGTVKYPAMVGVGFAYQDAQWMYGADFEYGNWSSYRYLGQTDQVQNNWTIRAGGQYYPYKLGTPATKYFRFVKYRAGIYYGSDYIKVNTNRPEYGFTVGTGMPLTSLKRRNPYDEYVVLNTALEFGSRGNKQTNVRESLVRFSIGVSMNGRWFQRRKFF
ncbi:MAG TPA: hypothetical protein VK484_14340, partial [Ferruginibacter sp.]|nr:hypothetical protein [Ferruginibacter sp.]